MICEKGIFQDKLSQTHLQMRHNEHQQIDNNLAPNQSQIKHEQTPSKPANQQQMNSFNENHENQLSHQQQQQQQQYNQDLKNENC